MIYTGHTLGAAGAIEAVISVLAIKNNFIPGNLRFETPIENVGIIPVVKTMTGQRPNHILSNSFGFGGNNSSLIFSRC